MSKPTFALNDVINGLQVIEDLGSKKPTDTSKYTIRFVKVRCLKCNNLIEGRLPKFKEGRKVCPCSDRRKELKFTCPYRLRILKIWHGIKKRCNDTTTKDYLYYASQGINICTEWKESFDNFYLWSIGNGYEKHLSIDRINCSKGYYPDNCRWADARVQSRNRKNTLNESDVIEIKDLLKKDFKPVQIAKKYGVPVKRIYYIKTGLTWNDQY